LLISTSKWPELQTIAPDFMTSNISPAIASRSPVTEMNTSPTFAASTAGMTSKPSINASKARSGSTSQTITWAPWPLARIATPRPHQPYPMTTTRRPAISTLVARITPSSVDWPVP